MSKKKDYIWRVTSSEDNGVEVSFGHTLSEAPHDDDVKLRVVGKALIQLGTRLMGSTVHEDDEWDED